MPYQASKPQQEDACRPRYRAKDSCVLVIAYSEVRDVFALCSNAASISLLSCANGVLRACWVAASGAPTWERRLRADGGCVVARCAATGLPERAASTPSARTITVIGPFAIRASRACDSPARRHSEKQTPPRCSTHQGAHLLPALFCTADDAGKFTTSPPAKRSGGRPRHTPRP
jgi:hypothetical protein